MTEPDSDPVYDRDDLAGLDLDLFFRSLPPSWQCPHCGRRSYSHHDLTNQYCGHCHHYCEDVKEELA